jgi:hypothetical protein
MIELLTARSGAPSVRLDGIALHSLYDPVREAQRFVHGSVGGEAPATIVLLGEGIGHITAAARDLHPDARVVRIFYSEELARAAAVDPGPTWHPGMGLDLGEFLRQALGELDLEGLRVIEWPPSARAFPTLSRRANATLRQVVQQLNGSFVTTVAAGRLWIRNSVANFLGIDSALVGEPCAADRPVLIAAPGPSLETAVPLISEVRPRVDLWALPSSSLLLQEAGLSPDLIVMTDPGYYSMHHLHFSRSPCPIAMPLSAARGAWRLPRTRAAHGGVAAFLLSQPTFFEEALLAAAGVQPPLVPPHGTVAASALHLALCSTRAPVIVAGLDMSMRDISSHARPNAFDQLLHLQSTRLTPHHGLSFARAEGQHAERAANGTHARVTPSLRTYAGWFDEPGRDWRGRVCRLLPSSVGLRGFRDLDAASLYGLLRDAARSPGGPMLRPLEPYPSHEARKLILAGLIRGWNAELAAAETALRSRGLPALLRDSPFLLSAVYHMEPRLLLEAGRKLRRRDPSGALDEAHQMFQGCISFLSALSERTLDAR